MSDLDAQEPDLGPVLPLPCPDCAKARWVALEEAARECERFWREEWREVGHEGAQTANAIRARAALPAHLVVIEREALWGLSDAGEQLNDVQCAGSDRDLWMRWQGNKLSDAIRTADETMRRLLDDIASEDALRSKAAAQRVASGDAGLAAGSVRTLLRLLPGVKEAGVQTHIVRGLETIMKKYPEHMAAVLEAVEKLDFDGREGLALAAAALLKEASRRGHADKPDLRARLKKASKLVGAMFPDNPTAVNRR